MLKYIVISTLIGSGILVAGGLLAIYFTKALLAFLFITLFLGLGFLIGSTFYSQ